MRISKLGLLILLLTLLGMRPGAMAQTVENVGLPYPTAATPKAIDLGELKEQFGTTPISVTIALRLPNIDEAEDLLKSINTPGNPQFHQFLTAEQFLARFAPPDADVAAVISGVAKYGLTAERSGATTLKVTGLPVDMERAFAVSLHSYEVPAHENLTGYTFHAPLRHPTIPAEISASTAAVVGFDNRPHFRPLYRAVPQTLPVPPPGESVRPTATGNAFGYLTTTDFANLYDVQPLYRHGALERGRTIGIMTLASFKPSDAFAYWRALGLSVRENRIRAVNIDGGPGAPSDASGSIETAIDVEQSGGVAPEANIVVYQAPNTNQGFVDIFARAVDANLAESLSISWGQWEWFDNMENAPVTNPTTGKTAGITVAVHELLVRAAIQGQTVFAAAGDGGAYDVYNDLGCSGPYSPSQPDSCSLTLSVDYPASDPAITAGGGTTLAGTQKLCLNAACTHPYLDINIPQQRVWGWDWLKPWCNALGTPDPITCGIFPAGGGGGVSVVFEEPFYQRDLSGIQRSQPHQVFHAGQGFAVDDIGLYYALPSNYPGRNVPDISFNADPYTGYIVYYTSEPSGVFSEQNGWGGTSFVGPQLNGVSALLGEYLQGRRLGLLNYTLYGLARNRHAYENEDAPLHAIAYGNNWFYDGSKEYNPAAGLGTLDVWNFAEILRRFQH
jgi:kumamolisin